MSTDLTFITNENETNLVDQFNSLLKEAVLAHAGEISHEVAALKVEVKFKNCGQKDLNHCWLRNGRS